MAGRLHPLGDRRQDRQRGDGQGRELGGARGKRQRDQAQLAARAIAAVPLLPPVAQWVEAASHPAIMDTARAKKELGWAPRFPALAALRDTVRRGLQPGP